MATSSTDAAIQLRAAWVSKLGGQDSGNFATAAQTVIHDLQAEVAQYGSEPLLAHLRVCGAMPEQYGHDSTAEKLYSKYTDAVVSETFKWFGLTSIVLSERGDAADVQARSKDYCLVADAKAFRLSRTAKNQKDFKIQALAEWRNGCDFAVTVCPMYQLPTLKSQIYKQAISRNVCILSYTHLATLLRLAQVASAQHADAGLHRLLCTVSTLHPSQSAVYYWTGIGRSLADVLGSQAGLWAEEEKATQAGLQLVKHESLIYLRSERDRLLGLSREAAIDELLKATGLTTRIKQVEKRQPDSLLKPSSLLQKA